MFVVDILLFVVAYYYRQIMFTIRITEILQKHFIDVFIAGPCPTGSRYNAVFDNCTYCPMGTYQDVAGALDCITCPDGTFTRNIASKYLSDCVG